MKKLNFKNGVQSPKGRESDAQLAPDSHLQADSYAQSDENAQSKQDAEQISEPEQLPGPQHVIERLDTIQSPEAQPDTQPPPGPKPDAYVPAVPPGPETNKQERVPARQRSTQNKAIDGSKCKRKRTSVICCEQLFADVQQQFFQKEDESLPLMHTPHSLFRMLCQSFEQEFPNCLPHGVVDQILLSLQQDLQA